MKVLGIDPGIERFGWALVEQTGAEIRRMDSGVVRTSAKKPHSERLHEISRFLEAKVRDTMPERLSIEKIFFEKNVKTAIAIGEIRGIALALAAKHNVEIVEFAPSEVKVQVAGYGRADKKSVAHMVRLRLRLADTKQLDDETDALALALCGIFHNNYREA